ncbi:signal peptidase I [Sutcliffiella horikoshii]|uniref:signal peptidase I n=1 Tax=Sutcliffiella horikoshii TaxID=79883 RepID=UPI001CFCE8E3|nr:signal peptidase I [Sutcliffiella horikoshii]
MKVLKIISRGLTVLLLICLVFAAILAISSNLAGGTPKFFGKTMMIVLSGSMEPTIPTGSAIFVEEVTDPTQLKVGDVITFESPIHENTRIITHRITEVASTVPLEFIAQGDNNQAADPMPIPAENILGKHSDITVPYLGYVLSFLQSKKGIGLALIIPGLLVIILEVISVWRMLGRMESKEKTETKSIA